MNYSVLNANLRASIGFVRLNTVKECRNFAYWLYQQSQPTDFEYAVICYHSRYTILERFLIENFLDTALARKDQSDHLYAMKEMQPFLNTVKKKGKKDAFIIVVTTSIQETGRDHDYDWAILEPCSTRSIVQSAGRIERHRSNQLQNDDFNLFLMKHPHRYIYNAENFWSFPGIETPILQGRSFKLLKAFNKCQDKEKEACFLFAQAGFKNYEVDKNAITSRIVSCEEAFDIEQLQRNINAWVCLNKPIDYSLSPLTGLEYIQLFDLLENDKSPYSLKFFLKGSNFKMQLQRWHAKTMRFRRLSIKNIYYPVTVGSNYMQVWYDFYTNKLININSSNNAIVVKHPEYALLTFDIVKSCHDMADKLGLQTSTMEDIYKNLLQLEIPVWLAKEQINNNLYYHPLLGLGTKIE
jgi:hypothetical protein